MATITLQEAKAVRTSTGAPPEIVWKREAADQSFKRGEFLSESAGQVTVVTSGAGATSIACMAGADASGTTNALIPCYEATDDTIFEVNAYHATVGSAVTNKNMQGVNYGLTVASNKHHLNIADVTNLCFHVVGLSKKDEEGDTYGRVEVRIKKAAQVG